jgi:hypothetical protein
MGSSVDCVYGRNRENPVLIGWLVGNRYIKHVIMLNGRRIKRQWPCGSYQIEKLDGKVVMRVKRHD